MQLITHLHRYHPPGVLFSSAASLLVRIAVKMTDFTAAVRPAGSKKTLQLT